MGDALDEISRLISELPEPICELQSQVRPLIGDVSSAGDESQVFAEAIDAFNISFALLLFALEMADAGDRDQAVAVAEPFRAEARRRLEDLRQCCEPDVELH
ncbi:hypothetical protein PV773_12045 [Mesorhizobium sp. CC13]|uniref:hypothetical protein n=1 Tax=Mesorhizobium sp. CC13 TaxID=3029194 RepID=UPI0032634C13